MEVKNRNGLIAVGITVVVVGGGILLYQHFTKPKGNNEFVDNFDRLKKNTGLEPDSSGVITVTFNDKKNKASFYNNDRVIIFDSKGTVVLKGSYSDGGRVITIDSAYGGKQSYDMSVYTTLNLLMSK